jgi:hypothetical protein
MNTVFTTMKKCMDMSTVVGQDNSIQTFDEQLYAVYQQVKWSMPNVFRTHILRLGGFHTLSCFIASIGKLWADGGLRDLMVDSGVSAGCTVDQMLSGKQFIRAVRSLTLVYEALMSLWSVAFFKWCVENIPQDVWVTLSKAQSAFTDNSNTAAVALSELKGIYTNHVLPRQSPLCFCNMLPFFFITNKSNYSRWTPVYILDMLDIQVEIKASFYAGEFVICQKSEFFNGVWSDMACNHFTWPV